MAVMRATAASASVYAWRPLTPAARNGSNSEVCSEAVAMPQHSMPQGTRPRWRVPLKGRPEVARRPAHARRRPSREGPASLGADFHDASDRPTRSLEQVVVVVIIIII